MPHRPSFLTCLPLFSGRRQSTKGGGPGFRDLDVSTADEKCQPPCQKYSVTAAACGCARSPRPLLLSLSLRLSPSPPHPRYHCYLDCCPCPVPIHCPRTCPHCPSPSLLNVSAGILDVGAVAPAGQVVGLTLTTPYLVPRAASRTLVVLPMAHLPTQD
jgi:hypothetical protein